MAGRTHRIEVALEVGARRVFASALDWPGWCRGGRDEEAALEALAAYGRRYARVLRGTRLAFAAPADASAFRVVERLTGTATTDFGAPGVPASAEAKAVGDADLRRLGAVLRASWRAFDAAVDDAEGRTLRAAGPRGGGRALGKIVEHVRGAEEGYLGGLGWKPASDDVRDAVLEGLAASARGEIPERGPRGGVRWRPRYFVRRVAWHALDHAWEIEDRAS